MSTTMYEKMCDNKLLYYGSVFIIMVCFLFLSQMALPKNINSYIVTNGFRTMYELTAFSGMYIAFLIQKTALNFWVITK